MIKLFWISFALGLAACNLTGSTAVAPTPVSGHTVGVFHAGPYTDPTTGKSCGSPGGYCEADQACHSDASKCIAK